jgi:AsmA family protein
VWRYEEISGTIGDTDLRGNATVTFGRERPLLQADMLSRKLDLDDLAGFFGAPPSGGPGETATPQQRAAAAALERSERILPRREWNARRLRKMDADVRLQAKRVDGGVLPIDSFDGRLRLEDGVAVIDPLVLGVAGGRVESTLRLDSSRDPYAASARLTMRALELPKLFARAELTRSSVGRVGGHLELEGKGNSVAALLATSDGEIGLVMGKGRISNLLLEVAGLDVAEALKFLLGKDRVVPLRCAYADLVAREGIVSTRRFVFDTTDTVLYGEGKIDLRDERLELELRPKPKDRSLVSLRSPLEVDGRLKDPDIHPKAAPLAMRGLAAAALYAIAPPATLLALIETGPGRDANCDLDAVAAQDEAE